MRLFIFSLVISAGCVLCLCLTLAIVDDPAPRVLLVIAMSVLALGFLLYAISTYANIVKQRRFRTSKDDQ